jgi:hypothetical protein
MFGNRISLLPLSPVLAFRYVVYELVSLSFFWAMKDAPYMGLQIFVEASFHEYFQAKDVGSAFVKLSFMLNVVFYVEV